MGFRAYINIHSLPHRHDVACEARLHPSQMSAFLFAAAPPSLASTAGFGLIISAAAFISASAQRSELRAAVFTAILPHRLSNIASCGAYGPLPVTCCDDNFSHEGAHGAARDGNT